MANKYISQVQLPNNETYNIRDKELIPRLKATVGHSCKNLLDITKHTTNTNVSNIQINETTGSLSYTGTGTHVSVSFYAADLGVEMYGKTYTVSCINNLASTADGRLAIRKANTNQIVTRVGFGSTGKKSITFTPDVETFPNGWYISVMATGSTSTTGKIDISNFMLREASISDDTFESYQIPTDERFKDYLPLTGGTVTGAINIKSSNLDRDGEAPTSDQTGKSLYFVDKDNNGVGRIFTVQRKTNNKKDLFISVHNASGTTNSIGIRILDDGTPSYYLSNSSAFRTTLDNAAYIGANTIMNNQVIVADGTDGKLKSSGYTIAANVPSGAIFTDTTYTLSTGDSNGQIKVTPSSGSSYNVNVKGLGSNAYSSTAYLPLSGGTLTGQLIMSGKRLCLKGTNIDSDEAPSSDTWSNSELDFVDKDNTRVSFFNVQKRTNGSTRLELAAQNNNHYNVIDLIIDKDGGCSYYVSDPAAFRTAIGAGTSSTDKNVAQANSVSGKYRPIMLGYDEYDSTTSYSSDEITNKVFKSSKLSFKPDSGTLGIYGSCVGNTASDLISGKAGVLSYGDRGPQIEFNSAIQGSQAGAIIYTDNDSVATGVSWSFVSNQADWNVISKRFHARTGISIGTELPQTSYTLYINGNTYATNSIFLAKTKGYYLTNSANNTYAAINDNGDNLWVGASSAQKEHHRGTNGQTYISSGWSTKNNSGNDTIFVSVPTLTTSGNTETWTHTAHAVLHNGNTSFTQTLSSGTKIGTIKINGTSTDLYCQTNTNTHRPIQVNGTEILGNNTTVLNLKAGNNITLSHSSGTVTITGTNTNTTYTLSTGDSNGQIKVAPSSGNAYNVSVKGLGSNAYTSTAYLPLTGGTLSGNLTVAKENAAPQFYARFDKADYTKDNNGVENNKWTGYRVLDKNENDLSLFYANIGNNGVIQAVMRAYNYNSSSTDNPYSAFFGVQVTKSGTVDYLFSHRLRFARNLTNESITTPQYVVSLTNSWENFGYTTIANLKTTLGIPSSPVYTDTKNTAGSTDTSDKIFLIGAKSQAANPQTYSDSQVYVTNGSLYLTKIQDAEGEKDNKPALLIGNPTDDHLELDVNEVMAKASATTTGPLYLNSNGGLVYANNKKVVRLTSDPTSGQVMIADGTNGQIKSSGYTINKSVPSDVVFTKELQIYESLNSTMGKDNILYNVTNIRNKIKYIDIFFTDNNFHKGQSGGLNIISENYGYLRIPYDQISKDPLSDSSRFSLFLFGDESSYYLRKRTYYIYETETSSGVYKLSIAASTNNKDLFVQFYGTPGTGSWNNMTIRAQYSTGIKIYRVKLILDL